MRRKFIALIMALLALGGFWRYSQDAGGAALSYGGLRADLTGSEQGENVASEPLTSLVTNWGGLDYSENSGTPPECFFLPPDATPLVRDCTAADSASRRLENVSPFVLRVSPSFGTTLGEVEPSDDKSPAAGAVRAVVRDLSASYLATDSRALAPGERVTATSQFLPIVDVQVIPELTLSGFMAKLAAGWLVGKLTPPSQVLHNSVLKCAEAASDVWNARATWQEIVGTAIAELPLSCRSLYKTIDEILRDPPKPQQEGEIAKFARQIRMSLWDDLLKWLGRTIEVSR